MSTQAGSGAHPKKVAARIRKAAKYPVPPIYTPDAFWTDFAGEVSCCRIKVIEVEPFDGRVMMSVAVQTNEELRWYTAPASDFYYWWKIRRIYKSPHHKTRVSASA